jgi:DUF3102 family protein
MSSQQTPISDTTKTLTPIVTWHVGNNVWRQSHWRPLNVLVPLIKKDLEDASEAAEAAAMPYYRAAGEKMLEVKGQLKYGEFVPWLKRHFKIGESQAKRYMRLARNSDTENGRAREFSSMKAFLRETGDGGYVPNKPRPQPWHEPVSPR